MAELFLLPRTTLLRRRIESAVQAFEHVPRNPHRLVAPEGGVFVRIVLVSGLTLLGVRPTLDVWVRFTVDDRISDRTIYGLLSVRYVPD